MRVIYYALLLAAFIAAGASIAEAASKARIQNTKIDFGKIEEGGSETRTIIIKNIGDSKLEIEKVETNSDSLIPTIIDKTIEPDSEGEIEVKFDTTGIKPCRLIKYVYVYPSDRERSVAVTCSAIVVPVNTPMIKFERYNIDLGVVYPGEKVNKTIKYSNVGSTDLEIEPIQYIDQQFEIIRNVTQRTLAPGGNGFFQISFEGRIPGSVDSFILLKSNSADGPYSKVSITGQVTQKSFVIGGLRLINTPEDTEGKSQEYELDFKNFNTPYKLRVTRLNGTQKGQSFNLDANRSISDTFQLDPEEPGKKISIQLDIIIEEPPVRTIEKEVGDAEGLAVEEAAPAEAEVAEELAAAELEADAAGAALEEPAVAADAEAADEEVVEPEPKEEEKPAEQAPSK